jgi:hypothetical protein
MDYLPIQASSVPCERVFSSSAETDTKKRNRISPLLMEALQILKYDYKLRNRQLPSFVLSTTDSEMIQVDADGDLLKGFAVALSEGSRKKNDVMDSIIGQVSRDLGIVGNA